MPGDIIPEYPNVTYRAICFTAYGSFLDRFILFEIAGSNRTVSKMIQIDFESFGIVANDGQGILYLMTA